MIDVYTIGMTLKLNDLVAPQLLQLSREFTKVEALAVSLNKSLKGMGSNAAGIRSINVEIGVLDTKLARANQQALMLDGRLRQLKASGVLLGTGVTGAGVIPPIVPIGGAPGGAGGNGRGRTGGGAGAGGGGSGGGHGGGIHGGNIHMGPGGPGIGSVGFGLGSSSMIPLAIGAGVIYMGHGLYEEAKKLEKARADFSNLNLSKSDNAEVLKKAESIAGLVHGTKITENLALIQDLHTATGDLHHSLELSANYATFANAAKVQNGGKSVDNLVLSSIKALEHRGDAVMQNAAMLDKELRMQSQVDFFTKGVVGPNDYYAMSRTGKLAYQLADKDYLYGPAAALISANSGATAGTMEMTALSSLVGGHMDKKAKAFMMEIGLWQEKVDPKVAAYRKQFDKDADYQKIVAANGGNLIQTGGLSGENTKLFVSDRNKFVLEVLMPAIKKKYGLDMSNEDIASLLSSNFNRNTSGDLSFFVTNQLKVAKDTAGVRNAKDFVQANKSYMETATGSEENFISAWTNFKAEFGKNVLPLVTGMLNDGAEILRNISEFKSKFFPESGSDSKFGVKHDIGFQPAWKFDDSKPWWGSSDWKKKPSDASIPPPKSQQQTQAVGDVYLDKQKVGNVLARHMGNSLNKNLGTGLFDAGVALPPPALNR